MKTLLIILFAFLSFSAETFAGLKIYYIRHGESGANIAKAWNLIPKDLWPPYVGNGDAFSPLGEAQVKIVPDKLSKYQFDFIAVSPKWRTRQTILGFLKQNGRKGEIWPEIEEIPMDWPRAKELIAKDNFQPERPDLFSGAEIELPDEEKPFFTLREDRTKRFSLRDSKDEWIEDCVNALRDAIARVKKLPVADDASVLLVGHGNSGRLLLHLLVKSEGDLPGMVNTGVWMAEQQPDGTFRLKIYNDKPVAPK